VLGSRRGVCMGDKEIEIEHEEYGGLHYVKLKGVDDFDKAVNIVREYAEKVLFVKPVAISEVVGAHDDEVSIINKWISEGWWVFLLELDNKKVMVG